MQRTVTCRDISSTMVSMYINPSTDVGRGPHTSKYVRSSGRVARSSSGRGVNGCLFLFAVRHMPHGACSLVRSDDAIVSPCVCASSIIQAILFAPMCPSLLCHNEYECGELIVANACMIYDDVGGDGMAMFGCLNSTLPIPFPKAIPSSTTSPPLVTIQSAVLSGASVPAQE